MPEAEPHNVHDPSEQLAKLQWLCQQRSASLYRDEALYLQILRDELPSRIRQALYRLVSDVDPGRFANLPESTRQQFHVAVDELVSRCSVLLTIEQLVHLVGQMEEEARRHQARANRELLNGLAQQQEQLTQSSTETSSQEPTGSVNLSFDLPLSEPQRYGALQPRRDRREAAAAQPPTDEGPDSGDLGVLRSLFQLAGEALDHSAGMAEDELTSLAVAGSDSANKGMMPDMPDGLLYWMEALDQALSRRFRNLSHAINVQMLRCGLASTLLPVTLLEAVLNGQVETHSAASNLLRLRLPMAVGDLEQGVDVFCLLLRSGELEFDSHRLRRCRRRLRQHQQELNTMVRQQRHWQRRYLDHEARILWQSSTDPKPPQAPGG